MLVHDQDLTTLLTKLDTQVNTQFQKTSGVLSELAETLIDSSRSMKGAIGRGMNIAGLLSKRDAQQQELPPEQQPREATHVETSNEVPTLLHTQLVPSTDEVPPQYIQNSVQPKPVQSMYPILLTTTEGSM